MSRIVVVGVAALAAVVALSILLLSGVSRGPAAGAAIVATHEARAPVVPAPPAPASAAEQPQHEAEGSHAPPAVAHIEAAAEAESDESLSLPDEETEQLNGSEPNDADPLLDMRLKRLEASLASAVKLGDTDKAAALRPRIEALRDQRESEVSLP